MWLDLLLLTLGLACLWQGSALVVNAAKLLSARFGVSHNIIGLSVLAIGTSLPEIFTSIYSGAQIAAGVETSGVAVGTIIGSEVGQITLILGVVSLAGVMRVSKADLIRDGSMLLVAFGAMALAGIDGRISQIEGALLCSGYVVYLLFLARRSATDHSEREHRDKDEGSATWVQLVRIAGGLAVLLAGGKLVVDGAVDLAVVFGISQSLIGTLVIGIGTSLPELALAVVGIRRGANALAMGSLIGSNITDPMLSLGSGATIGGFAFDQRLYWFEMPFWLLATLVALGLLFRYRGIGETGRGASAILIALFVVFVVLKLTVSPVG